MYEPSGKPIVDLETGWTKKIKACAIEPLKVVPNLYFNMTKCEEIIIIWL
jgi:hypothetical protein